MWVAFYPKPVGSTAHGQGEMIWETLICYQEQHNLIVQKGEIQNGDWRILHTLISVKKVSLAFIFACYSQELSTRKSTPQFEWLSWMSFSWQDEWNDGYTTCVYF